MEVAVVDFLRFQAMQYKTKLKRGEIETSSFETPFITFMYASSYIYNTDFISHDRHYLACCSGRS